jgi:hypothetical protein
LAIVFAAALGGLAGLGACHPPEFPRELFTIGADSADYPVMLSQTPAGPGGRKIEASSGTHKSQSSSSYSAGRSTVTTTSIQSAQSELSASTKLAAQVKRADKWVQIDGAELHSMDFIAYGVFFAFSSADRQLTIQGTVYP